MIIFFVFGYIKSYTSDDGGSTELEIKDILEIEKDDPKKMIQTVSDELIRLIVQNKLNKTRTGGSSEDFYSTFQTFFGKFFIPKKNGGPIDKEFITRLNMSFELHLNKIFTKR